MAVKASGHVDVAVYDKSKLRNVYLSVMLECILFNLLTEIEVFNSPYVNKRIPT